MITRSDLVAQVTNSLGDLIVSDREELLVGETVSHVLTALGLHVTNMGVVVDASEHPYIPGKTNEWQPPGSYERPRYLGPGRRRGRK